MSNSSVTAAVRSHRPPGRPKGGVILADRAQLLAAAERAIRADGPDLTMNELAAAATVSKPILYRTIGDRDALVLALSEALIDRVDEAVALATAAASPSPDHQFAASVRGYLAAVDADRNLFLFVNGGGHDTAQLRRLVDRSAARTIELLDAARTAAGQDPAASRTWAHAIIGAFQITTVMWLRDEYCDLDSLAEHLTQLLWPGVRNLATL